MLKGKNQVFNLKIVDHLVDIEFSTDLDYRKIQILAVKAEKATFKLYTDLVSIVNNTEKTNQGDIICIA